MLPAAQPEEEMPVSAAGCYWAREKEVSGWKVVEKGAKGKCIQRRSANWRVGLL